jgi:hypothetical protein
MTIEIPVTPGAPAARPADPEHLKNVLAGLR